MPDAVELRQGTAVAPDTDGDGTPDWVEVARDPTVDSDGDGLSDGEERWLRTDPNARNSDSDFVEDFFEVATGSDPRAPARGPRGQPIPQVPDGPYKPDPADTVDPLDPLPDGPQATIGDDGTRVARRASAHRRPDWNDPSATQNLDPPDVQAEYSE